MLRPKYEKLYFIESKTPLFYGSPRKDEKKNTKPTVNYKMPSMARCIPILETNTNVCLEMGEMW